MTTITLTVDKAAVWDEVAKATSYAGAKMADDPAAYDRIFTTDEDQELLERFWDESRAEVARRLKGLVTEEGETAEGVYKVTLELSGAYDAAQQPSMELSLMSYFVQSIIAKWYMLTNKSEAAAVVTLAAASLEDVREKAYHKKRPERPEYE